MPWPKNTDYYEAIQNPHAALADEELRGGQVACTPLGLPMLWTGSFADVYKLHCPATGNTWAVKCFTREVRRLQERYRSIAICLEQARLPFTVDFQYLEQGVRIAGAWFPALKMRWVEGLTLNQFVEEHLQRPRNLRMLLELWIKLAARLDEVGVAHADLQHGNVLLVPAARGALALRLIDYDGMYVPALAGTRSGELGHPAYQHPQRIREGTYNAEVDHFSHLVIYTAVHCLMVGRNNLWQRFNNGDNLLFREADFQQPAASELFRTLWELDDADAHALVGRLILACVRPLEESPRLQEIAANGRVLRLGRGEEAAVEAVLSAPRPSGDCPDFRGHHAKHGRENGTVPFGGLPVLVSNGTPGEAASGAPPMALPAVIPIAVVPADVAPEAVVLAELVPEAPVATRPASQQGTLPAAMPLPAARPRGGIFSALRAVVVFPVRAVDNLLLCMISRDNTILHNFFRAVAAFTIALLIGLAAKLAWPLLGNLPVSPEEEAMRTDTAAQDPAAKPTLSIEDVAPAPSAPPKPRPIPPQTVKPRERLDVFVPPPAGLNVRCDEPTTINAGQTSLLHLAVDNAQPDDGPLEFTFDAGRSSSPLPAGAMLDRHTGAFTWMPALDQVGPRSFPISVTSHSGRKGDLWLNLDVRRSTELRCRLLNNPRFVEAGQKVTLRFAVDNAQPGDGKLAFSLDRSPPGATIDRSTGELTWTAARDAKGSQIFTVAVQDGSGRKVPMSFSLLVRPSAPLRLQRVPTVTAKPGQPVTVQLEAENPLPSDGKLTFSLDDGPPGATLDAGTGKFTWTPPPEPAQARPRPIKSTRIRVSVRAASGRVAAPPMTFLIAVHAPLPARIRWDGPTTIEAGQELTAQVIVDNAEGWENVQYALAPTASPLPRPAGGRGGRGAAAPQEPTRLPPGGKLDHSTGAFTWKPTLKHIGTYFFAVQVKDANNQTVAENVTLTVTRPPRSAAARN